MHDYVASYLTQLKHVWPPHALYKTFSYAYVLPSYIANSHYKLFHNQQIAILLAS